MKKFKLYRNISLAALYIPFALITTVSMLFLLFFHAVFEINIWVAFLLSWIPALSLIIESIYIQIYIILGILLALYFHYKYKKQKQLLSEQN